MKLDAFSGFSAYAWIALPPTRRKSGRGHEHQRRTLSYAP